MLYWVPVHMSVDGNIQLAKKIAETHFTGLTASSIEMYFREEEKRSRSVHWKGLPGRSQALVFYLGTPKNEIIGTV